MTSETGKTKSSNKAFSIVEVLLVLALIAVIAGLFALNFDVLLTSLAEKTPEKLLHEVVRESRYQAIVNHQPVELLYRVNDLDDPEFIIRTQEGRRLATFEIENPFSVEFEQIRPLEYSRGRAVPPSRVGDVELDYVTFYPDSSSTPAILNVRGETTEVALRLDSLSCGLKFLEGDDDF